MRYLSCLVLVLLVIVGQAVGQSISIDGAIGATGNIIPSGQQVVFEIRYTNGNDAIRGITNGYKIYSPDGATWVTATIDTVGTPIANLGKTQFDGGVVFDLTRVTGSGTDTVGTAFFVFFGAGMPANFDDVALHLTVGPISAVDAGKQLCIDSTYFPPSGLWQWTTTGAVGDEVYPVWGGPYCFIVEYVDPDDMDGDGILDSLDNCPFAFNPSQNDMDSDGQGDVCDDDTDGDDVEDGDDNCPLQYNPDQYDSDDDGVGDLCDNCVSVFNPLQEDFDMDGLGDSCDYGRITIDHIDGMSHPGYLLTETEITYYLRFSNYTNQNLSAFQNGFRIWSPNGAEWITTDIQATSAIGEDYFDAGFFLSDFGTNGFGADTVSVSGFSLSGGGLPPGYDSIAFTITIGPIPDEFHWHTICLDSSFFQPSGLWRWSLSDGSSYVPEWSHFYCATVERPDADQDGISDYIDNCINVPNYNQADLDQDGIGDVCDICTDEDQDGFGNPGFPNNTCTQDNCPSINNPNQADTDQDGIGDECDPCTDSDGDGYGDPGFEANTCDVDNCPAVSNPGQEDATDDGEGDACCCHVSGDVNHSGGPADISDIVYLVDYVFLSGPIPACPGESNINQDEFVADISDLVYFVNYLFRQGPPPVPCPEM